MSHTDPQMKIRIPRDVQAWVKRKASLGERSLNWTIIRELRDNMEKEAAGLNANQSPAASHQ